jgi:nitrilase
MTLIRASARKHKITIALGFSENDRKLMPTHMERTIFGNCSGNSLDNVVATAVGNVGQLACWEHVQPLLKYHTITQREVFHVAAWPPVHDMAHEGELWSMTRDGE